MSENTEYEITYSLRRKGPGEDDFTEVGFGSSGGWDSPAYAAHILSSDIDKYLWETSPGMPDPGDIKRDVEDWQ